MGKTRGPYSAEYDVGSCVRILTEAALSNFMGAWRFHHPLQPSQLRYAGRTARVRSVSFYHGGDELYELEDIPGIWHEENLSAC